MKPHTIAMDSMLQSLSKTARTAARQPCARCRSSRFFTPRRPLTNSARRPAQHHGDGPSSERMRAYYKMRNRTTMYVRGVHISRG